MRKIFAAVILVLAVCGTSRADFVYMTADGKLGVIGVRSLSIDEPAIYYTGLEGYDFAAPFWNGHESRIMAVSRTSDMNTSGDSALFFTSDNPSEPVSTKPVTLNGVYNIQTAASSQNGRGLFAASRENASVIELDTENFRPVRSFEYKNDGSGSEAYMQKILTDYSGLCGLVSSGGASTFIRFDGQLKEKVKGYFRVKLDSEASSMSWISNMRIAVALPSGVGVLGSSSSFHMLVSTDSPVADVCRGSAGGFFFATQSVSGDEYVSELYRCSSQDQAYRVGSAVSEGSGRCVLLRHRNRSVAAALMGGKILICDTAYGEVLREFASGDLGGVPVYIANRYAAGDDTETSRGSCNVSGSGVMLLLSCMAVMMMMKLKE